MMIERLGNLDGDSISPEDIQTLLDRANAIESTFSHVEESFHETASLSAKVEEELLRHSEDARERRDSIVALSGDIRVLQGDYSSLETDVQTTEEKLNELIATSNRLDGRINSSNARISEVRNELSQLDESLVLAGRQVREARETYDVIEEILQRPHPFVRAYNYVIDAVRKAVQGFFKAIVLLSLDIAVSAAFMDREFSLIDTLGFDKAELEKDVDEFLEKLILTSALVIICRNISRLVGVGLWSRLLSSDSDA